MAAEYVCCTLTSHKIVLLQQPIACYEIAKRTYDFVMTYVGNRTINMTLVMLFPVGNKMFYYIIQFGPLKCKPSQNYLAICLLLAVSLCVSLRYCYTHAMGKQLSLTELVTLHGEGYTEWDITAKLRCSKTAVHNVIVKFNERERSGRPLKTPPREDCSMRQIKMRSPKSSCKTIRAILRLKGTTIPSSCFETSKQNNYMD